ncbi:unnamed protein product [Urochloa humidicola]
MFSCRDPRLPSRETARAPPSSLSALRSRMPPRSAERRFMSRSCLRRARPSAGLHAAVPSSAALHPCSPSRRARGRTLLSRCRRKPRVAPVPPSIARRAAVTTPRVSALLSPCSTPPRPRSRPLTHRARVARRVLTPAVARALGAASPRCRVCVPCVAASRACSSLTTPPRALQLAAAPRTRRPVALRRRSLSPSIFGRPDVRLDLLNA